MFSSLNPYETEIPSGKKVIYYTFDEELDVKLRKFNVAEGVYVNADYGCLSGHYYHKMDKYGDAIDSHFDELNFDLYDSNDNLVAECNAFSNQDIDLIVNQLKIDYNIDIKSKILRDVLQN